MTYYYVFNGDADGLCALQQLRLADPREASLVTGVKRDISLLERVALGAGDECTVLDVSLDVNRTALLRALDAGARVRYFDHHHTGEVPGHAGLEAHLDLSPSVCTSILVDRKLEGRHRAWAIVGAFGDNLAGEARALAGTLGLTSDDAALLQELGVCLNYNSYGETLADLHVAPADLAEQLLPHTDPLQFVRESESYPRLSAGYRGDMQLARRLTPTREARGALVFVLPDQAWARRASGVFANEQVAARPETAIAIVSSNRGGGYTVSLRVPKHAGVGADAFCRKYPSGGGRRTAAGINHLPSSELEIFVEDFEQQFRSG